MQIAEQLSDLTHREVELRAQHAALGAELRDLAPYADYLQQIVEHTKFESAEAIIRRYEGLETAREELLEQYADLLSRVGVEEVGLAGLSERAHARLIDAVSRRRQQIAAQRATVQAARHRTVMVMKDQQRRDEKQRELASIKMAIDAIYHRAADNLASIVGKQPQGEEPTTDDEKLLFIENRFLDLRDITGDAQSRREVG